MANEQGIRLVIDASSESVNRELSRAERALARFENKLIQSSKAGSVASQRLSNLGRAMRGLRGQAYNVSVQLQDMAVQAAAGTNWFQILGQQVPQLASAFGRYGAVIGVVAAVGFPLVRYLLPEMQNQLDALNKSVKASEEAFSSYKDTLKSLKSAQKEVADTAGKSTAALLDLNKVATKVAATQLEQELGKLNETLSEFYATYFDGARTSLKLADLFDISVWSANGDKVIKQQQGMLAEFVNMQVALSSNELSLKEQVETLTKLYTTGSKLALTKNGLSAKEKELLELMQKQLEMTREYYQLTQQGEVDKNAQLAKTRKMVGALRDEFQAISAKNFYEEWIKVGANAERVKTAIFEIAGPTEAAREKTAQVKDQLKLVRGEAEKIRATKFWAEWSVANDFAGKIARNLADARAKLAAMDFIKYDMDPFKKQTALAAQKVVGNSRLSASAKERLGIDNTPSAAKGTSTDSFETGFTAVKNALKTETELQLAAYAEQQNVLDQALAKRRLSQTEYNTWMLRAAEANAERLTEIDAYKHGNSLSKLGKFFGDAATATASGQGALLELSKKFAAASALISAYQGAAAALADPNISVWGRLAAYASVLSAGLGAVSAIKGVTAGGSTSGGSATTSSGASYTSEVNRSVMIGLQGNIFGRAQILELINEINEAVGDGATVRLA